MQKANILNQLFDEKGIKESDSYRTKNINKFIECFNIAGNNHRSRHIRILQIGNSGVATTTKKPFLTTQPIKKQAGLFNNEILISKSMPKDTMMHIEAIKTGFFVEPSSSFKGQSKTISPSKFPSMIETDYVGLSSSPKRNRGWIARKKKIEQLPKQFYRRSSQNTAAIANEAQIQIDQTISKSVNLLNKIKMPEQPPLNISDNKSGVMMPKPKTKMQANRKTPQQVAQQQRKIKLEIKRQISQDYAKPFNPPVNITAASYIIFEPKFSQNKGKKKRYFIESEKGIEISEHTKKKYPHSYKVIASFNSRNAVEVASLTKIMTCILTLEICERYRIDPTSQKILVGKFESNIGGTSAQICEGETYTVEDLFYGLMLPSGNDASVALAVWGGRTLLSHQQPNLKTHKKKQFYQRFIVQMNAKSKQLGMHKTTYANSHGLCNTQNRSCAFDLALLCEHAMENPKFREIVACKLYRNTIEYRANSSMMMGSKKNSIKDLDRDDEIEQGDEKDLDSNQEQNDEAMSESAMAQKTIEWENTHRLVQQKSNEYIGIKTGITTAAGPCLASCVKAQDGRYFIIIVLNCDKLSMRFKDTQNLKRWIYQREGMTSPRKRQERENLATPREQCETISLLAND